MNKTNSEPIECPYCGEKTVLATVLITYYFRSEHTVFTDGLNIDGDTVRQIVGEMSGNYMRICNFRCTSCGKEWLSHQYKLVSDENGVFSFEKQAEKRKG